MRQRNDARQRGNTGQRELVPAHPVPPRSPRIAANQLIYQNRLSDLWAALTARTKVNIASGD